MRYLLTRLGFYLVALWGSLTINFLLPRLAPGDPASSLLSRMTGQMTPAQLNSIRLIYGVDTHASLLSEYGTYLGQLAHGNLGISTSYFPTPVSTVIASAIWWTVLLGGVSLVIGFAAGAGLGILVAWRRATLVDSLVTPSTVFLASVPYFWLATAAVFILGIKLNWLPVSHSYNIDLLPAFSWPFIGDVALHAVLPVATIVAVSVGNWLIVMRSTMISVLSEDYITMAIAKGLSPLRIALNYGARNALLPVTTTAGVAVGFIVSGALLTEVVFSYSGVGYLLFTAVEGLDYPLIQGLLLIITVGVLAANLLVDGIYVLLDPRVRRS
ncbi:MAG TPA: ABC transporter permease [Streptosporangiaceae bacterium]|jgi:peptide/nickel transport system permease protein